MWRGQELGCCSVWLTHLVCPGRWSFAILLIHLTRTGTTHEQHLVVFIVAQNLIGCPLVQKHKQEEREWWTDGRT